MRIKRQARGVMLGAVQSVCARLSQTKIVQL